MRSTPPSSRIRACPALENLNAHRFVPKEVREALMARYRASRLRPRHRARRRARWAATAAWTSSWTTGWSTACSMACRSIRTFTTRPSGRASASLTAASLEHNSDAGARCPTSRAATWRQGRRASRTRWPSDAGRPEQAPPLSQRSAAGAERFEGQDYLSACNTRGISSERVFSVWAV